MNTRGPIHVLVTGASGRTGREVARQLLAEGVSVRSASRSPESLPSEMRRNSVYVDMKNPETISTALEGIDAVFLIWPFFEDADSARKKSEPIAKALGERNCRVVYLSAQTVEREPAGSTMWGVVEDAVTVHVNHWTMLRPTGFARNAEQWIHQSSLGNSIRFPFADMARPLIHERDIAAVAARALLDDGHNRQRYVLSGPDLVSQRRQVELLGEAAGRNFRYVDISRDRAEEELKLPREMLDAWAGFIDDPEPVTGEVERLAGKTPQPFDRWARDNAALFRI